MHVIYLLVRVVAKSDTEDEEVDRHVFLKKKWGKKNIEKFDGKISRDERKRNAKTWKKTKTIERKMREREKKSTENKISL